MNQPILAVSLGDDGTLSFTVRPCVLSTDAYGRMLASIILQIGVMFDRESGGEFRSSDVSRKIVKALMEEYERPTAHSFLGTTQ